MLPCEEIKHLSVKKRRSVRALARNSGLPKSTLQDHIKKNNNLDRHTTTVHPELAPGNDVERLRYDISKIIPDPQFTGSFDEIHVDEKWFELTETVSLP